LTIRSDLSIAACAFFAIFLVLGLRVSRRPLGALDALAAHLRGQMTPAALVFTISGRSIALIVMYAIAFIVFALTRLPFWIPVFLAGSQIVSQIVVELFKALYARVRPDYWLVGLEAGHSYPSGHACTAVVSFAGWALAIAIAQLPAPVKSVLVAAFLFWALGIVWSRLALGAHYLSDVAGGVLFGCAWLCALSEFLLGSALVR
jgi:undecaprenyl-diphosphatase